MVGKRSKFVFDLILSTFIVPLVKSISFIFKNRNSLPGLRKQ